MAKISAKYAAGLFDGEGCVVARRKGVRSINVAARVTMTDPRGTDALYETYGGGYRTYQYGARRRHYVWYAHGGRAKRFFNAIRPHALIKKDQIELAQMILNTPISKWTKDDDPRVGFRLACFVHLQDYKHA